VSIAATRFEISVSGQKPVLTDTQKRPVALQPAIHSTSRRGSRVEAVLEHRPWSPDSRSGGYPRPPTRASHARAALTPDKLAAERGAVVV
jgi:hypothetical protein